MVSWLVAWSGRVRRSVGARIRRASRRARSALSAGLAALKARINALARLAGFGCLVYVFWEIDELAGLAAAGVVLILASIELPRGWAEALISLLRRGG